MEGELRPHVPGPLGGTPVGRKLLDEPQAPTMVATFRLGHDPDLIGVTFVADFDPKPITGAAHVQDDQSLAMAERVGGQLGDDKHGVGSLARVERPSSVLLKEAARDPGAGLATRQACGHFPGFRPCSLRIGLVEDFLNPAERRLERWYQTASLGQPGLD